MLEAHSQSHAESFRANLAANQLALLVDDIQAANKQRDQLHQELNTLTQELTDLEFNLTELQVEKEQFESNRDEYAEGGDFFGYLAGLEQREVETRGQLEGHKQLSGELAHQINRLTQKNKKLVNELQLLRARFTQEKETLDDSKDVMSDLELKLTNKEDENSFLVQQCDHMHDELIQRSSSLKKTETERAWQLNQEYAQKKEELRAAQKENDEVHYLFQKKERDAQKILNERRAGCSKAMSVSSWKAERGALVAKLKKTKTAIFSEKRTQELAIKRDRELAEKMMALTGSESGDNDKTRAMLFAEIETNKNRVDVQENNADIEREMAYHEDLLRELDLLNQSAKMFKRVSNEQLASLREELEICSNNGYLEMLREELKALQSQVSNM